MKSRNYKLDYYTDMRECCGGNVGGTIYIELTEEEADCLQQFIDKAKEEDNCDLDQLPEELGDMLKEEISHDVDVTMACDALSSISYCDLYNPPFSERKWNRMEYEDQVNYIMSTASGDCDFEIVEICNLVER